MAAITIPTRSVNAQINGATEFKFASGLYAGTLENFEQKPLPSRADGTPFVGHATTDGTRLSVRLGDIVPLEDTASQDIGNRKFFLDLVLSDGDQDVTSVDTTARDVAFWQLQKSATLIATLAGALGEAIVDNDETVVVDGFLDALIDGGYAGTRVGFKLVQNAKGYVNLQYFTPAE